MKKKIIISLIIAIFAIFVIVGIINLKKATSNSANSPKCPKNGIPVQVEEAKKDTIISTISATGVIDPANKKSIFMDTQLKVDKILVKEGDIVKKCQILIQYNKKTKENLESQLEQAKINLEIQQKNLESIIPTNSDISKQRTAVKQLEMAVAQTERALETAKDTSQKNQTLYKEGAISKELLNQSEEQVKSLEEKFELNKLQLDNAKSSLQTLLDTNSNSKLSNQISIQKKQIELQKIRIKDLEKQIELVKTETRSPIDGTVLTINAVEGSFINPSYPVIEIGNLSKLKVLLDVSEFDAPSLKIGQKVKITGDAFQDEVFHGVIDKIAPSAVKKQTSTGIEKIVQVEALVTSKNTDLKPGFTVETDIITAECKDVIVVPIIAPIKEKDENNYIYLVNDDYTIEKRKVKLGHHSDLYIEVTGIKVGEKIITNPSPRIKEGMKASISTTKGDKS